MLHTKLITVLIVLFLGRINAFRSGSRSLKLRKCTTRSVSTDEELPRLELAEENDSPRISIDNDNEREKDMDGNSESGSRYKGSYSTSVPSTGFNTDRLFLEEEDKGAGKAAESQGSATFGGMSIDDLQSRMQESPYRAQSWDDLPDQKEDLNGINPVTTIAFSVLPMGMCYLLVQVTSWLSEHFAIDQVDSDIYPVQRGAVVARNLVVGISSLATGFTGVVGVGLLAMGIAVAVGVTKGELDPNKDNITGRVK